MHSDGDLMLADGLDRRLRLMVTPSASKEAMMSRTLTEPNNWPVSEA
jgi:hypothetical protein